ncbi:MAG: hypothetical protein ACE5WD_06080 [Candidatus Aminicenantia bacterium]
MEKCGFEKFIDLYLLDQLSESQKESFENHYFNCPHCAQELVFREKVFEAIQQEGKNIFPDIILSSQPKIRLSWLRELAYFLRTKQWAVALTLLLLIFGGTFYYLKTISKPKFILISNEVIRGELISPTSPQGEIQDLPSLFIWRKLNQPVEYKLFLYDQQGDLIWETTTKTNRTQLPEKIRSNLKRGEFYSWKVIAYLPEGVVKALSKKAKFKIVSPDYSY